MIDKHITALVSQHYGGTDEPLLLSELGKRLRVTGDWPPPGETLKLSEFIEQAMPGLQLKSDPDAKAFVVVIPRDRPEIAERAFQRRRETALLRRLPRGLLLAFCANVDRPVWLTTSAPFRYTVSDEAPDTSSVLVDAKYRTPGVFVDENRSFGQADADRLLAGLKGWAEAHGLDLDALATVPAPSAARSEPPGRTGANALERLYAAQPSEWREKLIVPVDIAVKLSRLP